MNAAWHTLELMHVILLHVPEVAIEAVAMETDDKRIKSTTVTPLFAFGAGYDFMLLHSIWFTCS